MKSPCDIFLLELDIKPKNKSLDLSRLILCDSRKLLIVNAKNQVLIFSSAKSIIF